MTDSSEKYFIGETFVNIKTQNELFEQIKLSLARKEKKIFFYLNSYSFYLVHHNKEFKSAFNSADFILIDGMSIVYLLKKYKYQKVQKVTPNHSYFNFLEDFYIKNKTKIYLLGTKEENVFLASQRLIQKGVNVVGFNNGFFENSATSEIINKINLSQPEILIVGLGMPKCEQWIYENKFLFGNYIIMSVGNLIDIFSGKSKIAPNFLFNSPFEWIYRLLKEPKKLFKRYLVSNFFIIEKTINEKY